MGNTGSVDGGTAFKHVYATIQMPAGCYCTECIPSKSSFKYDDRAKLIPEKTTEMLKTRGAMPTYDEFIKALADSPTGMMGSWSGMGKELFEITTQYESKFEAVGVKLYLCKFSSKDGEFWWFMFEDVKQSDGSPKGKTAKEGALWKEYGSNKNLGGSW